MTTVSQIEYIQDPPLQAMELLQEQLLWREIFTNNQPGRDNLRELQGPLCALIDAELEQTSLLLKTIDNRLQPEDIHPNGYMPSPRHTETILSSITSYKKHEFIRLKKSHIDRLGQIGLTYSDTITDSELSTEALNNTPYYSAKNTRKCVLLCKLMLAESLAGQTVTEKAFSGSVYRAYGDINVDTTKYTRALTSRRFSDEFGINVSAIELRGATLATINKIANGIKYRRPNCSVYCTVPIQSSINEAFWHQVILLGDTKDVVVLNDPGGNNPQPGKELLRKDFYKRWSTCHNIAQIYISEKS